MANHDPNHSSQERTILWTIIVATLAVALLFTNLSAKIQGPREALNADMGLEKVAKKAAPAHAPAHSEEPVMHSDTTHQDTAHVAPAHAPAEAVHPAH